MPTIPAYAGVAIGCTACAIGVCVGWWFFGRVACSVMYDMGIRQGRKEAKKEYEDRIAEVNRENVKAIEIAAARHAEHEVLNAVR